MLRTNATLMSIAVLCLLQACTAATPVNNAPTPVTAGSAGADTVPELTLNLPEENCTCVVEGQHDYTFLERGFAELAEGDHIEAVQAFQRYKRLEQSPSAQLEADIAIAYVSTLSKSPFYDPVAARKAHRRLYKRLKPDMEVHQNILFMRDSLETFGAMQRHIVNLQASNATLKEDLMKREKALKRLRELTLGQPAERQ